MGDYAEVKPSGESKGSMIKLADVLPHLKGFKLRAPFAWIVGGLAVHGETENDIDILLRAGKEELSPELRKALEVRICRALPPELADRVEFHTDELHGPITDAVPLYDLACVTPESQEPIRMGMTGTGSGTALVPQEHREEVIKEPPEDSDLRDAGPVVLIVIVARAMEHEEGKWVYALAAPMSPEFTVPETEQIELSEHKFAYLGRTTPTVFKFQPGARIPVEVDEVRLHTTDEGECLLNLVDARVLDPKGWPKGADKFAEIIAKTRHEGILIEKSADGTVVKAADVFTTPPPEGKTFPYVVQEHWRGKSVHADIRIGYKRGQNLLGWTAATQIPGKIKEPVESVAQAKRLPNNYSKINWATGEWAQREGGRTASIFATRKAPEPWGWLRVQGRTEPGEVGATTEHPGIFVIVDRGKAEYGAQQRDSHEYFFSGGKMPGRVVFRKGAVGKTIEDEEFGKITVPAEEGAFTEGKDNWLMIRAKDQTPYVLSSRAESKGWIPPRGHSALPARIRSKVPDKYRYWTKAGEGERKLTRNELRDAMKRNEVSLGIPKDT